MKSMNNSDQNSTGNNSTTNASWLGFSLSPHMKMELPTGSNHTNHQTQSASDTCVPTAIPTSFFQSQPHLNRGICYGSVEGDNQGSWLYSPLPVMPLRSDGSLCIMEALTRSHPEATTIATNSTTPKLEDFFGGGSMGAHHYETNEREAMALSLDSMYYHQEDQQPQHEPNNPSCLNQHYPYYTYFRSHEVSLVENGKGTQMSDCNLQLPTVGEGEVKNWVPRNYTSNPPMESKLVGCMGDDGGGNGGSISAMPYGDLQSLSLSMSPGSQSSCVTGSQQISPAVIDCAAMEISKKRGAEKVDQKQIVHRKSIDTFGQRTSQYRGVTRHRWTGRYEAHLWDNSCKKEGQSRKGRQVYLGGYDMEEKAARAYDLAALKYWGPSTHINFPMENYQKELEEMKNMTRQEYVAHLRRKSSGFSRGASIYRGVTRHHQHGRWQARIGRVAGNKDLYLGTFSTQEEAAEAYDIAAIKFRGINAVTNFDITRYDVERIMASNTLLSGDLARRNKDIVTINENIYHNPSIHSTNGEAIPSQKDSQTDHPDWKMVLYHSSQQQLDHKSSNFIDDYRNQAFTLAPEGLVGIDNISSVHQQEVEDSAKIGTHLSNASSLATSVNNSREGSPDKGNLPMLFAVPPSTSSKLLPSPNNNNLSSWMIPSTQLRSTVSLPNMPLYAAWSDS